MGNVSSKETPAPTEIPAPTGPPALLSEPWKSHILWTPENRAQLLEYISKFKVNGGIKYLNCLLLGQSASGKTSFFNTVSTALLDEGRLTTPLTVYKTKDGSVTSKFETSLLNNKQNETLNLRIYDCRGLHNIKGGTAEDVRLMVDGHIKHGYVINPESPISNSDPLYRDNPGLGDVMHCVVYVVNADNPGAALASEAAELIFSDIRSKVAQRHVPQVVLMNKVDRLRASLADDISKLFHSVEVRKKLNVVADFMNLPAMKILPMSNYHNESVPNTKKDVLALTNLKTIMDYANDFVYKACPTSAPTGFYD